jgi:hypothetical protein
MTKTTITWTPELDAQLLSLVSAHPGASQAKLAELLSAMADVPATKKSIGNRLERLRHQPAPVSSVVASVTTPVAALPFGRVEAVPSLTYLKSKLPTAVKAKGDRLVAFIGDTQWPYEDKAAFRLALAWIRDVRPDAIYLTGDMVDAYEISRFGADGGAARPSIQEEITYAHARLAELRSAAGADAEIFWIAGNHEERLVSYLARVAQPLLGLRRAGGNQESVLSLPYLVAADSLGVTWVGASAGDLGGDYVNAQVVVTEGLIATHGYHSRKGGGGSSILPLVERWGVSVVGGHDHRAGIAYRSIGGVANVQLRRLAAVSTGMMCRQHLGYNVAPDWQAGFATATLFAAGGFSLDLATIDPEDGVLSWRGQRWLDR